MSPEQIQTAKLINEATNKLLEKYGLPPFDIPEENIHVILKNFWKEPQFDAYFTQNHQEVNIKDKGSISNYAVKVFHEILHFKSYGAAQVLMGDKKILAEYRLGIKTASRDGDMIFFRNLNEAITERMTKKYAAELLSDPLFKKEQEETRKEKKKFPSKDLGDFYFMEEVDVRPLRNVIRRFLKIPQKTNSHYMAYGYSPKRKTFHNLVSKLFTKNPGKFKDETEGMELFESAMMTGRLHGIGQLIDKTFPRKTTEEKGTFRKIGELGEDSKGLAEFVDAL